MRRRTHGRLIAVLAIACMAGETTRACCPAWRRGEMVRIADQRILVAFDPRTGVEHFVREARFAGDRADADGSFGFLVPSPAEPEIAEADGGVFDVLERLSSPRIETVTRLRPRFSLLASLLLSASAEPTSRLATDSGIKQSAVQVVKTVRVAGYDAVVLRADDPRRLAEWLAGNGFDSRPELVDWSAPYVAKGWMITAFRYVGGADRVDVAAVRMSFATDTPLFPYRVPTDQVAAAGQASLLRAYVVGPGRATGVLGEGPDARPWSQAEVKVSRPLTADGGDAGFLATALPAGSDAAFADAWLTTFDDPTWPSGTDDLTFGFDAEAEPYQRVVRKTRDRDLLVPLDVIALVALGLVIARHRRAA